MAQDGLSRAEIDAVTDEDIHVTNVEYVVQKLDCRLTETMFDSSLFSEDEGEPFAFGAKFASYLCAFADDVGDKVDLKLRSARPNTNATAKQLARELHRHLHGVYGQHKVSVMAEVMSIWFAAKDVRAKPITARRVTVLLDD